MGTKLKTRQEKNVLNHKEHPLRVFYPMVSMIQKKITKQSNHLSKERMLDQQKKGAIIAFIILISLVFSFLYECKKISLAPVITDNQIIRPSAGAGDIYLPVVVFTPLGSDHLKLLIEEQIVPEHQRDRMFEQAIIMLEQIMLGKNNSWDNIQYDLHLTRTLPNSKIKVEYVINDKEYIDTRGTISFDHLTKEQTNVIIHVILTYEGSKMEYEFEASLIRKEMTALKDYSERALELAEQINETTRESKFYELPQRIEDQTILWEEEPDYNSLLILFLGILGCISTPLIIAQEKKKKEQKQSQQMLVDYPEIISKFTLFINAGMTTRVAWKRIVSDYCLLESNDGTKQKPSYRVAYQQMMITKNEQDMGISEELTYSNFGKRCKLLPYLRFSSILAQNLKKGGQGMIKLLEAESAQAFLERKENAKRQGEVASAKLLGPSIGMLIIVLLIIMIPAFLAF